MGRMKRKQERFVEFLIIEDIYFDRLYRSGIDDVLGDVKYHKHIQFVTVYLESDIICLYLLHDGWIDRWILSTETREIFLLWVYVQFDFPHIINIEERYIDFNVPMVETVY